MKNRERIIAHWKRNRADAFRRGMFKEIERIDKILKFYGETSATKRRR